MRYYCRHIEQDFFNNLFNYNAYKTEIAKKKYPIWKHHQAVPDRKGDHIMDTVHCSSNKELWASTGAQKDLGVPAASRPTAYNRSHHQGKEGEEE